MTKTVKARLCSRLVRCHTHCYSTAAAAERAQYGSGAAVVIDAASLVIDFIV